MRDDVSALWVDPRGPYPKLVTDWWDEARDARGYQGPRPIVAHPPCAPWSASLASANLHHTADHALIGLAMVRRWSGVLEHPAHSRLWTVAGLPRPGSSDAHGRCVEIQQVDFGHPARKRT